LLREEQDFLFATLGIKRLDGFSIQIYQPIMFGIFASSQNDCIGRNNKLPWYLPEDLAFFKMKTTGHIIVMGRKTFESFPPGGLPKRIHVVITSNPPDNHYDEILNNIIYCTLDQVHDIIQDLKTQHPTKKVFVIGGASIFHQLEDQIDKYYVTHIKKDVDGDVFYSIDDTKFTKKETIHECYSEHELCSVRWVEYFKNN
jgi:dihydrofolate reductase